MKNHTHTQTKKQKNTCTFYDTFKKSIRNILPSSISETCVYSRDSLVIKSVPSHFDDTSSGLDRKRARGHVDESWFKLARINEQKGVKLTTFDRCHMPNEGHSNRLLNRLHKCHLARVQVHSWLTTPLRASKYKSDKFHHYINEILIEHEPLVYTRANPR